MSYRIGVDIGGTFTDFTVAREGGELLLWKQDSTPDDPGRAVVEGLAAVAEQLETDVAGLLGETELFVHGTTVATNMLIQRNGPTIGLLCTEGFRDVLYFRDGYKPERFNIHLPHPRELVDRWLTLAATVLGTPLPVLADLPRAVVRRPERSRTPGLTDSLLHHAGRRGPPARLLLT